MTVKNITELLNAKKYAQIKKELNEMNSVDLAELLEQFPQESMVVLFRLIAKETAAEVFTNMNTEMQQALISTFTEKELKDIFEDMFMDDTVDIRPMWLSGFSTLPIKKPVRALTSCFSIRRTAPAAS